MTFLEASRESLTPACAGGTPTFAKCYGGQAQRTIGVKNSKKGKLSHDNFPNVFLPGGLRDHDVLYRRFESGIAGKIEIFVCRVDVNFFGYSLI